MPVFLSQSDLGRGDLRLFLTNENGYKTDPFFVKWTVFSESGKRVSGNRLPATRAQTGEYYAPWCACADHGCYEIVWDYQLQPGCAEQSIRQSFFIIDHSKFQCCGSVCPSVLPDPCCNTYMIGSVLGRGGLCLFLKDGNGLPLDAYSVTWRIYDANGCAVTPEYDATQVVTGEYYASWFVNVLGGNYTIHWKVIESSGSPAELFKQEFSVLSPTVDICLSKGNLAPIPTDPDSACLIPYTKALMSCGCGVQAACSSPCSPIPQVPPVSTQTDKCCPFEIPRVVHLTEQNLPIGGGYTNQPAYSIPSRIRSITFYIKYRRNAVGGRSCFKLLWGNGTEETQSTLIDLSYNNVDNENSEQDMFLNAFKSPIPIDDDFINFQIETSVPAGATKVRLLAAECGQPTQPGIIAITLTAAS